MAAPPPTLDYQPQLPPPPIAYTRRTLVKVFTLTLLAGIAFTLGERIFPVSMPWQIERLNIPRFSIAFLMGTLSTLVALPLLPFLSYISDRTRTRHGRRIPYLAVGLIAICLMLPFLGFTDQLGRLLKSTGGIPVLHLSESSSILLVMTLFLLPFEFFNILFDSAFFWLFGDIIPHHLLGRFFALYRILALTVGSLFTFISYKIITDNPHFFYPVAAFILLLGFLPLCLFVRERPLPPPTDVLHHAPWLHRLFHAVGNFFIQCFSHPIYLSYYAYCALMTLSEAATWALGFYYHRHLHLSTDTIGKFGAVVIWFFVLLAFPLGWLVDKIHPLRALLISFIFLIPITLSGFFMNSFTFYVVFVIIRAPFTQLMDAAASPLSFRLYPINQYAQFSYANSTLRTLAKTLGTFLTGYYINYFVETLKLGPQGNAYAFLWQAACQLLALPFLLLTYHYWKKHGANNFSYQVERRTPQLHAFPVLPA